MKNYERGGVKRALLTLLPHITAIMAVMFMVFFVIDQVNEAMAFIDNDITKWLLLVFSVLTAILSVYTVIWQYKRAGRRRASSPKPGGEE